ncbi:(4S)-4-hydroxy-5-phosphonooxypentane-2,3-dione isomerase [Rahnella inusitata]|uniref:(4S)-4-hydroxy-5-phosphonooxypentane-2,3-dione isomerase n=1 Tax=Rahnella inusitata TaxID=58169 RepID=UPI0039BE5852
MEVTLVEINVQPDKIDVFLDVFHANHLGAVQEPGNLRFDVLQDADVATRFFIYEAYVDEAAVMAHKKTPHYLACVEALEGIMSQGRKKTVFKGIYP